MSADYKWEEIAPAPWLDPETRLVTERRCVTEELYQEIAEWSENFVEYLDGEMIPKPRASHNHSCVQMNSMFAFFDQLDRDEHLICSGSVRVRPDLSAFLLADLYVVSEKGQWAENDIDLLNPLFLMEVHSDSSRDHDIIRKLPRYLAMPSLEHILYIEQDRVSATHHLRVDGDWTQRRYHRP